MPRYLVERSFPDGLAIPVDEGGAKACQIVVDGNATEGVTWVHSYVTPDKRTTFCVYDGPSPRPSAGRPRPTSSPWTASPRSGCWTRTSTARPAEGRPPPRRTRPWEASMSKLARVLTLAAMLAAMNLAGMTTVAHAYPLDPANQRHRALGQLESLAAADHPVASRQQSTGDATVRRLLARERSSIPNLAPAQAQVASPAGSPLP